MPQLSSISRLPEQVLRAEISCREEETGFSYRDFKEKSLFRLLETGVLVSWLPGTPSSVTQAGISLWLPGLIILLRTGITKHGFIVK